MNTRNFFSAFPPIAAVLGVNAVPILGVLRQAWTAEVAMLLYYLETVAVVLLVGIGVRLVVPDVDERGERIAARRNRLVKDYWTVMLGFSLVIGIFLAAFLLFVLEVPIPWRAVGVVMIPIVGLQLFALAWEARRLRPLDIADANRLISRDMGRIAILHLGVLFGVFVAAIREEWFVWPFVILKTLVDVAFVASRFSRIESPVDGDNLMGS